MAKLRAIEEITGKVIGSSPKDPPTYFRTCRVCGQRFDARDLDAVIFHKGSPHAPMKSDG